MQESDEALYAQYLRTGDNESLKILLERHRESLTLFLYGYVRNMEDAEELMMDAYALAASGTSRFDGRSSFKTWLYGIGRHMAFRHLRKRRIRTLPADENTADPGADTDLKLLREERDRSLYAALLQLKEEYRQVLYLLYFEGAGAEEAAEIMKKTRKQIYNLTARGKAELKETLERMGIDGAYPG